MLNAPQKLPSLTPNESIIPEHSAEHEVAMAEHAPRPMRSEEAVDSSHEVQVSGGAQLMSDKQLVGALGSACNRTCAGSVWLKGYLSALADSPTYIQNLVAHVAEREVCRFGRRNPSFFEEVAAPDHGRSDFDLCLGICG